MDIGRSGQAWLYPEIIGDTMEKFIFTKKYEDRDYLYNEYVTKNRSSKDIGKELHISYKLVELWLTKFDIAIRQSVL